MNIERIYAGLTGLFLTAGVAGGGVLSQNYDVTNDHTEWTLQRGQLTMELKEGLPQVLTNASVTDQRKYEQKIEEIKAIDSRFQNDTRNKTLENIGATGVGMSFILAPLVGVHWYVERRNRKINEGTWGYEKTRARTYH